MPAKSRQRVFQRQNPVLTPLRLRHVDHYRGPQRFGRPGVTKYFKTQTIWETAEFKTLNQDELLFLSQAKQRFKGEPFATLLRDSNSGRISEAEIRSEFTTSKAKRSVDFETVLLPNQPDSRAKDDDEAA